MVKRTKLANLLTSAIAAAALFAGAAIEFVLGALDDTAGRWSGDENPFVAEEIEGLVLADAEEGKCGEGKCGSPLDDWSRHCPEGKCGGDPSPRPSTTVCDDDDYSGGGVPLLLSYSTAFGGDRKSKDWNCIEFDPDSNLKNYCEHTVHVDYSTLIYFRDGRTEERKAKLERTLKPKESFDWDKESRKYNQIEDHYKRCRICAYEVRYSVLRRKRPVYSYFELLSRNNYDGSLTRRDHAGGSYRNVTHSDYEISVTNNQSREVFVAIRYRSAVQRKWVVADLHIPAYDYAYVKTPSSVIALSDHGHDNPYDDNYVPESASFFVHVRWAGGARWNVTEHPERFMVNGNPETFYIAQEPLVGGRGGRYVAQHTLPVPDIKPPPTKVQKQGSRNRGSRGGSTISARCHKVTPVASFTVSSRNLVGGYEPLPNCYDVCERESELNCFGNSANLRRLEYNRDYCTKACMPALNRRSPPTYRRPNS